MLAVSICPDLASLQRFLLGHSNGSEAEAVEQHLEQCERCLSTLHTLEAQDSVIEAMRAQSTIQEAPRNATVQSLAERLKELRPTAAAPSGEPTAAASPHPADADWQPALAAAQDPLPSSPGDRTRADYDFLAPPEKPGELGRLGPYHVLKVLGAGGMGVVFLARDPHLERFVALKAMLPAMAANPSAKQRFLREARAAAAIKHDHIVTIYQVGEDRGAPFLAMEFLEGEALDDRLKRHCRGEVASPLSVSELLRIGREMADGLAAAHKRGLIHRDIKPGNVWLEGDRGRVKILDFGLVRAADDAAVEARSDSSTHLQVGANPVSAGPVSSLTQQGAIVGTPAYMAPEQAEGRPVDARSDLFSLGCVLYRMATGEPPFKGKGAISTLLAVAMETPPPPQELNPDLPAPLCDLVKRLLAKKAEDRPPSARAVVEALEAIERERAVATLPMPGPSVPLMSAGQRDGATARPPRRRWPLAAACLALLFFALIVAAAVVFKIQSESGEIVIETNDPNIEVVVKRGGKEVCIVDPQSKQRWRLDTEKYQLSLADQPDGLTIDLPGQQPFILRRQGEKVATVTRLPVDVAEKVGEVRRFEGHTASVDAVAYSPDGRFAVSATGYPTTDGTIRLWDVTTGKEVRQFKALDQGIVYGVLSVAFSPDGRLILVGGQDPAVRLLDVDTGKEVRKFEGKFEGHTWYVNAVAFSPNGHQVLSGGDDRTVRLWDADTGKEVRKFEGHTDFIEGVAFSPDGKRVLSCSFDKTIRLWEVETGKELKRFEGHEGRVHKVAFSPDGRYALSGGPDEKTVRLWDVETGTQVRSFEGHEGSFEGHEGGVLSVAFSPDGRRALSGGVDKMLRLWDVETGKELHCFQGHGDSVWGVAFSPDGRYALSGSQDKTVRLWRLPDSAPPGPVGEVRSFVGHKGWGIRGVAFTPDGRQALSSDAAGLAILWNVADGKEVRHLEGHQGEVCNVSIAADGRHAATCGIDNTARVWDLESGKQLQIFQGNFGTIEGVSISPDARRVLTSSGDGIIRLWDVETGNLLRSLTGHTGEIRSVVFSHDGRRAVSGGQDKTVRLWDVETGKEIKRFTGHDGVVTSVAVSADGGRIVSCASSGGVEWRTARDARVWDVVTGKEVCRLEANQAGVEAGAFTPDGRYVLSGGTDKVLRLWDAETGREVWRQEGLTSPQFFVAVSADGRYGLSSGGDLIVRLWRLPDVAHGEK